MRTPLANVDAAWHRMDEPAKPQLPRPLFDLVVDLFATKATMVTNVVARS